MTKNTSFLKSPENGATNASPEINPRSHTDLLVVNTYNVIIIILNKKNRC